MAHVIRRSHSDEPDIRMNLFKELDIEDRLQWKRHQMIFAMQVR